MVDLSYTNNEEWKHPLTAHDHVIITRNVLVLVVAGVVTRIILLVV